MVWNTQNKWIGLPVFLFAILCILAALYMLQNLADAHYRKKLAEDEENNFMHQPEPSPPALQKRAYQIASVLLALSIIPIAATGRLIENHLDWKPIMFHMLIISPLVGMIGNRIWKNYSKLVFDNKEKEHAVVAASFLVPILCVFHIMVLTNYLKDSPEIMAKKVFVQRKSRNELKGNNYVFLDIDKKRIRFEIKKKDFENIKEGDSITVHIKKGGLGYPFVDRFE